jgi:hypothetical protein
MIRLAIISTAILLAGNAISQQCLQWHCQWVNTTSTNPQQICVCMRTAVPQSSAPSWGAYASDAPSGIDYLAPYKFR